MPNVNLILSRIVPIQNSFSVLKIILRYKWWSKRQHLTLFTAICFHIPCSRNLTDLNETFPMNATNWNPEIGYPPNTPAGTLPWRPRGAGTSLGLTVVLDAEVDEFYCSTTASNGFKVRATASTIACGVSMFCLRGTLTLDQISNYPAIHLSLYEGMKE
jgi:hypothetical protein